MGIVILSCCLPFSDRNGGPLVGEKLRFHSELGAVLLERRVQEKEEETDVYCKGDMLLCVSISHV